MIYLNGESTVINVIYYASLIGSQMLFVYLSSKSLCGTPQIGPIFLWGLLPWVFIFMSLNVMLKIFPGWKSPFSNTFGYLVVSLMGVKDTLNSLLKTKFTSNDNGLNKIAEKIYEDHSILINEMTPENFYISIDRMKPMFDTAGSTYNASLKKLEHLVRLKDEVSRGIWYILTGILTISISNMGIVSSKCVKTAGQIKEEVNKYHQEMGDIHKDKGETQRNYIIRD
jgi:hypothetical protein